MNPVVTPLHPVFVAKITEVDLAGPIDETTQRAIESAMDRYAVCVLPGQHLEDEEQIAFSRLYGALEAEPEIARKAEGAGRRRRITHREIFDISNLDENGSIVGKNEARSSLLQITQLWHTDLSFRQEPAKWSMLHAKAIPPAGGDTEYTDPRAAYDTLPDAMKRRLEGLVAEHSAWHSTAQACRLRKRLWEYSYLEASTHFVRVGLTSGAELDRLSAAFAAVAAGETISAARKPVCRRLGHASLADDGRPVTH